MEKPQRPEPDEAFAKLKMIDYFRDLDLWADQEHARAERLMGELADVVVKHDQLHGQLIQSKVDHGAAVAKLHALESRLPDCPPCEMGENTDCICDSQLVPKEWLDETVKEREALESQLKQALEPVCKAIRMAEIEMSGAILNNGGQDLKNARNKLRKYQWPKDILALTTLKNLEAKLNGGK